MLNRRQKIEFGILQIFYWCSFASFSSFAIALVRTKGISPSFIGIMSALYMLCAVLGQFFWGGLCDRFQSNKTVYILTNALLLLISLLFYTALSPAVILLAYAAMGFLQSPTASNLDSWVLKNANNDFSQYGPIRAMGPLGYAFFIFYYGTLVNSRGYWILPIFLTVFTLASIIVAITVPENQSDRGTTHAIKITHSDIQTLFTNKAYLFLLIVLFFVGFSSSSLLQNKVLIWEYLKAPISYQGFDSSLNALFQVPFLFLTVFLSKIDVRKRLAAGLIFTFIMFVVVYFAKIPQIVVVGSIINGIGYGLLLPSMREIIAQTAPDTLRTTAQGLGDAVYSSLSGIIGCLVAGFLIDAFDVRVMILNNAVFVLIALGLVLISFHSKQQRTR